VNAAQSSSRDNNVVMRRLIIFVGGELAVVFFGYCTAAIWGFPFWFSGLAGSAMVAGATLAWPRYRVVTYLGLGLIVLLALVAAAFAGFVMIVCSSDDCM
jgi:hypothetical protein